MFNQRSTHRLHRFTLVEIMVTLAIIVVMMGFLFHFVIGAQRIWSATSKGSEMFEEAQIILQVLESDLKGMVCELAEDNPSGAFPVTFTRSASDELQELFFMSSQSAVNVDGLTTDEEKLTPRVGVFPVYYKLVSVTGSGNPPFKLYRGVFDRAFGTTDPFFAVGIENKANLGTELQAYLQAADNDNDGSKSKIYDVLSENIETLKVKFYPEEVGTNGFLEIAPISAKIELKLRQSQSEAERKAAELNPEKEKDVSKRVFSKIVFLN